MRRRDEPREPSADLADSDADPASCGLLRWTSSSAELNMVLELYLREAVGRLFRELASVYLYGSGALGDLAVGHGDVDLLAVMHREVGRAAAGEIEVAHRYLASPMFGPWGRMIDAAYYSQAVLSDPRRAGQGVRAAAGEVRHTTRLHLGAQELISVHDHGVVLHGEDVRRTIVRPPPGELLAQVLEVLERARTLGSDSAPGDWVAAATGLVRSLYLLEHGTVASKSEATRWFVSLVGGKPGDAAHEANRLRRGELKTGVGGLRKLMPPFLDAVEDELARLRRERTDLKEASAAGRRRPQAG
jgi:hypothetical protein